MYKAISRTFFMILYNMARRQPRRCYLDALISNYSEIGRVLKCDKCGRRVQHLSQNLFMSLECNSNIGNRCPIIQQWSPMGNNNNGRPLYCPKGEKKQAADSQRNQKLEGADYSTPDIVFYLGWEAANRWYICTTISTMCNVYAC